MTDPQLPIQQSPVLDAAGFFRPEWYAYLQDLLSAAFDPETVEAQILALQTAVAALQQAGGPTFLGPASVRVMGGAEGGWVLELWGDQAAPAADLFYGTTMVDGQPVKGWRTAVTTVNDATGTVILNNTETVSTATRDLVQADRDKYLRFDFSGAKTLTINPESTTPITQDSVFHGRNSSAGNLTITPVSPVVVNLPPNGSLVIPPDTYYWLERIAEDVFDLFMVPVTSGEAVTALSIASGVVNIDCSLGKHFTLALTANVTSITFSNLPASGKAGEIAVRMKQDGTGGRTVAIPSSFKATGGSDTAVQSAANAYTLLTAITFDQGTRWEYAMQEIAA